MDASAVPHLGNPLERAGCIAPTAFIAHTATLVGDVRVGPCSSIWFGAVLRGEVRGALPRL